MHSVDRLYNLGGLAGASSQQQVSFRSPSATFRDTMSSNNFAVHVYSSALRVPSSVLDALKSNEPNANCVLPILLKSRLFESRNEGPPRPQVWVVCSSGTASGGTIVEFVLSVTEGYLDSYPVFFFATLPTNRLTQDFLQPRMEQMVVALRQSVPVERVYAVYGPDLLARVFAWCWTRITGVQNLDKTPYYAAKLSFCTTQTLRARAVPLRADLTYEIRPANHDDILQIAECCFGFASDSVRSRMTPLVQSEVLIYVRTHTFLPKRAPSARRHF